MTEVYKLVMEVRKGFHQKEMIQMRLDRCKGVIQGVLYETGTMYVKALRQERILAGGESEGVAREL